MGTKYREPVGIEQPDNTDSIWNYMSFSNFKRLLENRVLYFSKMSGFSDRQEGLSTLKDIDDMARDLEPLSGGIQSADRKNISMLMEHALVSSTKADYYTKLL